MSQKRQSYKDSPQSCSKCLETGPLTKERLHKHQTESRRQLQHRIWPTDEGNLNMSDYSRAARSARSGKSSRRGSSTASDTRSRSSSRNSDPHSSDFKYLMEDNGVYGQYSLQVRTPENIDELRRNIDRERASMSPPNAGKYQNYVLSTKLSDSEAYHMLNVVPCIYDTQRFNGSTDRPFTNLSPFTPADEPVTVPKPDLFDGAPRGSISRQALKELSADILPSQGSPVIIPNYAMEVKGPKGLSSVAALQIAHDGAAGQRAVESMAHYSGHPWRAGHASALGATYAGDSVQHFATSSRLNVETGNLEYHTVLYEQDTPLISKESYHRTVKRIRNAREYAEQERVRAMTRPSYALVDAHGRTVQEVNMADRPNNADYITREICPSSSSRRYRG